MNIGHLTQAPHIKSGNKIKKSQERKFRNVYLGRQINWYKEELKHSQTKNEAIAFNTRSSRYRKQSSTKSQIKSLVYSPKQGQEWQFKHQFNTRSNI